MKREYFGLLFIIAFLIIYLILEHYFGVEVVSKFIVIWVLIGFFVGQYSTRFPKM